MISLRSVRFRLLAAVNTAIALLLGVFLVLDYNREIADRVAEKHIALEEETKTILPAVMRMRPYGKQAVQRYIDDVCGKMRDAYSPGHHIAVTLDGTVFQAVAHHRASPEIFAAMRAAARSPQHRAKFGEEGLVIGVSREADAVVYVSEYISNIHQSARAQVLRRLLWIVLLVVTTAIVVNLVFLRMAVRPLRRLVATVRQIANGQFDVRAGPFKSEEFDYLADAINSMSSSLADTERHRRLEMDRARSIQEKLLPNTVEVPGLEFAHLYLPAEDVAGDYYDMISLPCGACLACIADVAGHGVPAALCAAMLKAYLQDASENHSDPAEILKFLNHRFAVVSRTDTFATMFIAIVDSARETLRYASAGHETGLFINANGQASELRSTGLILGAFEDADCTTNTIDIGRGDRLLLVTDGVTEAMNPKEEVFGRKRLADTFMAGRHTGIHDVVKHIGRVVAEHCADHAQTDDVTLLAFEVVDGRPARHAKA